MRRVELHFDRFGIERWIEGAMLEPFWWFTEQYAVKRRRNPGEFAWIDFQSVGRRGITIQAIVETLQRFQIGALGVAQPFLGEQIVDLFGIMLDPRPIHDRVSDRLAMIVSGSRDLLQASAGLGLVPRP